MRAKQKFQHIVALLMAVFMLMGAMPLTVFATETEGATDTMILSVSSVNAMPGDTVQVTVNVANNPGVASLKFNVAYDDALTLTAVEFNSAFGAMVTAPQPYTNPQPMAMISPFSDINANGVFATLTFAVGADVADGYAADVSITYDAEDIFNIADEEVPVSVANGTVHVYNGIPGDLDGNGEVDTWDANLLFRHVAGWSVDADSAAHAAVAAVICSGAG